MARANMLASYMPVLTAAINTVPKVVPSFLPTPIFAPYTLLFIVAKIIKSGDAT